MQDVKQEEQQSEAQVQEDVKEEQETEEQEETSEPAQQAGDKTDPSLLLKSLQEERNKRRELEDKQKQLEERLEQLQSSTSSEEYQNEEGDVTRQISSLEEQIKELRSEGEKKDILLANPILKDKWEDFQEFWNNDENKGMSMKTASKAFLIENGLLESPKRKGLEKPTGGEKTSSQSGMSVEDVERLRKTNFRKYTELLMKGQIKVK